MNADDRHIHIALASDNNYFEGLVTTAVSIAANCSRPREIVFHVLDGGLTEDNIMFFKSTLARWNCQISFVDIAGTSAISGFRTYHGSTMTYARILLPGLLPDVEWIVYSDVDILWFADVAELWDGLDKKAIVHYVPPNPDSFRQDRSVETEWLVRNGFQSRPERRFNAGMIVLNLRQFRTERLQEKMLRMIEENGGHAPNVDETILNAFMSERDDTRPIDFKWQIGTGPAKSVPADLEFVLHYAADTPWKTIHANHHMLTDSILLWHKVHAQVRNMSTWRSLRSCNGATDIVLGRALYLSASNAQIVRGLLLALLLLRGHGKGRSLLKAFMAKSNVGKMLRRRPLVPGLQTG